MMGTQTPISRRRFLQGSAGLIIAMQLPSMSGKAVHASEQQSEFAPNAFLRIDTDSQVTVLIKHIEIGQGAYTGLATLAAEELDADWNQMHAEHAPANVALYANSAFGVQGTGGSTGLSNSYQIMRQAGAQAKALLVAAAAQKWGVPADQITVAKGTITHSGSGRSAQFGELVKVAMSLPEPKSPAPLKTPDQFVLIGTDVPRLDTPAKSTGKAKYTLDIYQEGMLTAVVAHPDVFGAKVATFDADAALKIHGVVDVKQIPSGIAVYAKNTHSAIKGRQALNISWDFSNAETRSSAMLDEAFKKAVSEKGNTVTAKGDADAVIAAASSKLEVELHFPYLAHAPMEPLDAVMVSKGGNITAWFGSQIPTVDKGAIAYVFGVKPEMVDIQTQLAGGSFGRRTTPAGEFAVEAAFVTKNAPEGVPVKTVWTREDDIQGGWYRPKVAHKITGALDDKGQITAWRHVVATQSILKGSPFEMMIQNGIDATSVEGVNNLPYKIDNIDVSLHDMDVGVPVLWWRSVGHTHTGYAAETFIDMLLERAERDPVQGRLELLKDYPRESGVIEAVAKMADAAGKVPEGRARGVAMVKSFGTYVAQIAEVSRGDNDMPKVHRVWCAVDCGLAVSTNVVKAQIEGGLGYGLDALLHGELTLGEGGKIQQSNFHNYATLRINEMPQVEIEIIKSDAPPTGVGEPGTPPIGPAVSNAWRRLTGQYVHTLPFAKGVRQA